MSKLRVGSLFSGIGGFELGLERAGMEVAWQVEIEPYARRVLAKHWPDVPRWDDVRTFPPDPVEDWAVDLVCGGFPCQPVSLAGHQKGEEDERWLWDDMRRVCDTLKPRWVLAENVPGLLSACDGLGRRGALFGGVLRDLASLGYVVEWHCLPAGGPGGVGAPHKRLRVWIIGHLPDAEDTNEPTSKDSGRTDEQKLGGGGGRADVPDAVSEPARMEEHRGGRQGRPRAGARKSAILRCGDGATGPEGYRAGGQDVPDADNARRLEQRPAITIRAEQFAVERGGWWSPQCRLGRDTHGLPDGVDECRGWECGVDRVTTGQANRVARLKGLGNAVVPQVVELIGRAILEAEAADG